MVPWPAEAAARYTAEGHWAGRALGEHLLAAVDRSPDAVAVVDKDLRLTFAQLQSRADGAALRLRELGLRPDDRMLVQLPNSWEFVVLTAAAFRLGVIPVMVLTAHREHELSHLAKLSEARAIAVPDAIKTFDHQDLARRIAAADDTIEHVLVAGDKVEPGHVDLRALCAPADDPAAARAELDAMTPNSGAAAVMLLSGGTTGTPKLIARTHDDYHCYVVNSAERFEFGPGSAYLGVLPFGHNFPLSGILGVLFAGGRVVVCPSPVPEVAFPLIERERVTQTALVPAILSRWLDVREADPSHDLSTLELLTIGAARMPDSMVRRIEPALGCVLQQGYGMAEGLTNLTLSGDPQSVRWESQGRPICTADELMVVDDAGEPVPAGERGELLARGPYTVRGYYRAPEQDARAFTPDGWYRTGDVVVLRPDGYVEVVGRTKDVINRGGEKVAAEEVEGFAYQVPGIAAVAAVAMPDDVLGERVCLYAMLHEGAAVELEDVVGVMVSSGVAKYKYPDRLVIMDVLPTTPIGKIDKNALRADIAARLATAAPAV
jgi:2,3-dihydroxybenzoate-AMP ligase